MSFNENRWSAAQLRGNVTLPRNTNPLIRAYNRRSDPDGGSAVPYYSGASGQGLKIEYTDAALAVQTVTVALTGDGYSTILANINAVDPTNLAAIDLDGFLAVKNLNPGSAHYIKILPHAVPASDAAPILGFVVDPGAGSVSYAGELASAPGIRVQKNPQGTFLLGKDEDLNTGSLNRAFSSVLQYIDLLRVDLDREVIGFREFSVTTQTHPVGGTVGFYLDAPAVRIPVNAMGVYEVIPTAVGDLDGFFEFVSNYNETQYDDVFQKLQVVQAYYYKDNATGFSNASGFVTWGDPDGKSIYQPGISNKTKHPSVAIDSILGGVVYCPGATFSALFVQKGDRALIQGATNLTPFDHNGWFVVDEVIDTEHLLLRPMSRNEAIPTGSSVTATPSELNPTSPGLGNLSVHFGDFVPCSQIFFEISDPAFTGMSMTVRMAVGLPLRDMIADHLSYGGRGNQNVLGIALRGHLIDSVDAHAASAITGFTSVATWKNGSTIAGATLQDTIENILTTLSDSSGTTGGSRKIGADAVSIGGSSPNSLSAGSVRDQLVELLTDLQAHVLDGVAHAGAGAPYSGSPLWKDGGSIAPGVTIDQALDQIVSDLGGATGSDGAAKINSGERTAWLGGRTNPANVSILAALNKIITDLGDASVGDSGVQRIAADAMTEAGQVTAGGTVRTQLDYLASMWAKTNRANTFSALQTVNGTGGDTNGAFETTAVPSTRKLLWTIHAGSAKVRLYSRANDTLEITTNARWNGSAWAKDTGDESSKFILSRLNFAGYQRDTTAGTWDDGTTGTGWNVGLVFSFTLSTKSLSLNYLTTNSNPVGVSAVAENADSAINLSGTNYNNQIHSKNTLKAWISLKFRGLGLSSVGITAEEAFNVSAVAMTSVYTFRITFPFTIASNYYVPLITLGDVSDSTTETSTTGARALKPLVEGRGPGTFDVSLIKSDGTKYDLSGEFDPGIHVFVAMFGGL